MPKYRSLSKNSRAARILLDLDKSYGLLKDLASGPVEVIGWEMDAKRVAIAAKERQLERQERKRLEKRGLLKIKKIADRTFISLTEIGARELFRLHVLNADLLESNEVCMVVFDIPESQRKLRAQLRRFLHDAGFLAIQRSVWISPFDASEQLSSLFAATDASRWIRVYISRQIK